MTRKPTTPIVYACDLPESGIQKILFDTSRRMIIDVPRDVPHAVVRDKETGNDLAMVIYDKENGLPYAKYSSETRYMLWGYSVFHARRISTN